MAKHEVYSFRVGSRDYPKRLLHHRQRDIAVNMARGQRGAGERTGRVRGTSFAELESARRALERGALTEGW